MSARADQFVQLPVPAPLRWLGAVAIAAVAAAAIARLRERARQPKVSPMSPDWLQSHAADRDYYRYD